MQIRNLNQHFHARVKWDWRFHYALYLKLIGMAVVLKSYLLANGELGERAVAYAREL